MMLMKPKISVIVPIYNTEQYLSKCIDSILAQSYDNFELILVNDGSQDGCAKICEEYSNRDSRIKTVCKENGGISSARNAGLEIARGDYLAFLDSDDYVEVDFLEKAYITMISTNVDLYIGGFSEVNEADGKKVNRCVNTAREYSITELLNRYEVDYPAYWLSLPWGKLYKAEIIRNQSIRFDIGLNYKEDALFVYTYLQHVERVYYDSQVICNYRMLRCGSMNSKIHTDMYEINCRVYSRKRELMKKHCSASVYDNVYFGSLLNSIEYFYTSDHTNCMANRRRTISAVCENDILPLISMNTISGRKRKLMFLLCRMKAKKTIAAIYWLRSRIRSF